MTLDKSNALCTPTAKIFIQAVIFMAFFILLVDFWKDQRILTKVQLPKPRWNSGGIQKPDKPISNKKKKYLCLGYGGRLGNHIFAYASGFSLAKDRGMIAVPFGLLPSIFKLSLNCNRPTKPFFCWEICRKSAVTLAKTNWRRCNAFDPLVLQINGSESVRVSSCLRSWKYLAGHETEIRNELQFHDHIQAAAEQALCRALEGHTSGDRVIVGVHVRRGDRLKIDRLPLPGRGYYIKAMDFMRAKFGPVIFVVCSEDIPWSKANLQSPDTVFVETGKFEVDFAVLCQCNHTIMSVGTFGWWASFLANGTTVYYKNAFKPNDPEGKSHTNMSDYMPPDWIAME